MKINYRNILVFLFQMSCATAALAADADSSPILIDSPQAVITRDDLMAELAKIPASDRGEFLTDVKRINTLLEQLYVDRVLAKEAETLQLPSQPEIEHKLQLARDKVLAQARMAELDKSTEIPDFSLTAKEQYLANKENYYVEPKAHALHILIGLKDRSEQEALKKAQEVREMVVSGAKTFEQAAKEFSDDPTAKQNGGDLNWFEAKRMVKPFSDAVFSMEPGTISQPVKTGFGYHIILLREKKDGIQKSFDDVKQGIIKSLRQRYLEKTRGEYLNQIKADKNIVVHDAEIIKLNPLNDLKPAAEQNSDSNSK